jgi:hypothetical protein
LRNFITHPSFLNENVLKMLFALTDDKIDAVRTSITQLIVDLINKNSKDWADQYVVPKLAAMKENASYLKKQNLVDIFEVFLYLYSKQPPPCPKKPSRNSIKTPFPRIWSIRCRTCGCDQCKR